MNRKELTYQTVEERIELLLDSTTDWIAALSTVVCELHHSFDHFHWTGFYRTRPENLLHVGPYQGEHGCLQIAFEKGVCGMAASTKRTQIVPDVDAFDGHIACSSLTRSEIVVPLILQNGSVVAVLDVDSHHPDAFDAIDQRGLESICALLTRLYDTGKTL
jgi:L-methionine (R)-S-oxide reductase